MGARGSTTFVRIINVVTTSTITTIGIVATELFTHLPRVLGRCVRRAGAPRTPALFVTIPLGGRLVERKGMFWRRYQ